MKIAIFGCSWSSGIQSVDGSSCWPHELAKISSDWKIYNFSSSGTSLIWSLKNLLDVKDAWKNKDVFYIFQYTNRNRYTFINSKFNILNYLQNCPTQHNYYKISNHIDKHITKISPANIGKGNKNAHYNYFQQWITHHEAYGLPDYISHINYIQNNVNFSFFHRQTDINDIDILAIEDILGKNKFGEYSKDNGNHFGINGATWQAEYIKNAITSIATTN